MAVFEQLPHLGQEDPAQRHQLLSLLPAQVQGILQIKYNKIDCVCKRLKFSVCRKHQQSQLYLLQNYCQGVLETQKFQ